MNRSRGDSGCRRGRRRRCPRPPAGAPHPPGPAAGQARTPPRTRTTTTARPRRRCPRAGRPRRRPRPRPAASRCSPRPSGPPGPGAPPERTGLLEATGERGAEGSAVPVAPGEPARHDERQPQQQDDLLAALEVGEHRLVEDLARRPEDRAREMVDEQLSSDRERDPDQHRVDRDGPPMATVMRPCARRGRRRPGTGPRRRAGATSPPGCRTRRWSGAGSAPAPRAGRSAGPSPGWGRSRGTSVHGRRAALDLVDDLRDVEDHLVALELDRPGVVTLQQAVQGLLRSGVDPGPDVVEGVGREELADLPLDEPVDGGGQRSDELLQPGPVGTARPGVVPTGPGCSSSWVRRQQPLGLFERQVRESSPRRPRW